VIRSTSVSAHLEQSTSGSRTTATTTSGRDSSPYLSRDPRWWAGAAAFSLVLFAASWYRHATYRSGTYDMAVFDQAIWLMAHGKAPFVTTIGRNIFADHFSPVILFLVPLYWIASTPAWLLAVQALALGVGLAALGPLLDEIGVSRFWRMAFVATYVTSTMIWNSAMFDFHPSTLALPILIAALNASLRDDGFHLLVFGASTLLFREDMGLALAALALVNFNRSRHRKLRIALVPAGLAWFLAASSFGIVFGSPRLWHDYYGYLAPTPWRAVLTPWVTIPRLIGKLWRREVFRAILIWLAPMGFLPLLRPGVVLAALLWALPLLAAGSHGVDLYHYNVLFPFLLVAAGTGVARVSAKALRQQGPIWLLTFSVLMFLLYQPFRGYSYAHPPSRSLAEQALGMIEPTDRVSATDTLGPHLSHRSVLKPFSYPFAHAKHDFPLAESVTIVSAAEAAKIDAVAIYSSGLTASLKEALARLGTFKGFRLLFDRGGILIYRRVGTAAA
jgi:uncharacterized membrane protein